MACPFFIPVLSFAIANGNKKAFRNAEGSVGSFSPAFI